MFMPYEQIQQRERDRDDHEGYDEYPAGDLSGARIHALQAE